MAVSGSTTSAYRVWLDDVQLCFSPTTTMRDLCDKPDAAIHIIRKGGVATVAGATWIPCAWRLAGRWEVTEFFTWFDGAPLWAVIVIVAAIYTLGMLLVEWGRR